MATTASISGNYELPNRIYVTKHYPVQARNGSSIIVYGHDEGLAIWWRGGRPIKGSGSSRDGLASQLNGQGTGQDDVMLIDSDEDDRAHTGNTNTEQPRVEYEDEEEELNPTEPYETIVAHAQINLGTAIHDLDVPSLPFDLASRPRDSVPFALTKSMVIAVACSDRSTRLISLPLSPLRVCTVANFIEPLDADEDVAMSFVTGPTGAHQSVAKHIAMTYTASDAPVVDMDAEEAYEKENDSWKTWLRHRRNTTDVSDGEWELLIASCSAEPTTRLIVSSHRYQTIKDFAFKADENDTAFETTYLPSAVTSLSFNPSRFPSQRHTRLILAESSGVVRSLGVSVRGQNDQYDAPQSDMSIDLETLFTLTAPLHRASSTSSSDQGRSCRLLGAVWALDGRGVLALLDDGQWGIWDLEGAGPMAHGSKTRNTPGHLFGGSDTQFTIRGHLGHHQHGLPEGGDSINGSKTNGPKEIRQLAPMTPNTRKARQENLFNRSTPSTVEPKYPPGGIAIAKALDPSGNRSSDESVLLWLDLGVYAIPSLTAYWQKAASNGGPASSNVLYGSTVLQVPGLSTLGESITSVAQVPHEQVNRSTPTPQHMRHDIMVSAEHRLVMLSPKRRQQRLAADERLVSNPLDLTMTDDDSSGRIDKNLLGRGELDLAGMNRMLDSMGNGGAKHSHNNGFAPARPRKVGFAR